MAPAYNWTLEGLGEALIFVCAVTWAGAQWLGFPHYLPQIAWLVGLVIGVVILVVGFYLRRLRCRQADGTLNEQGERADRGESGATIDQVQ